MKMIWLSNDANLSVRLQNNRLRIALLIFIGVLSIPMAFLIHSGYEQTQHEEHLKYIWNSQHIVKQLNDRMSTLLQVEEQRPFEDYRHYKLSENVDINKRMLTLSPLAKIPDASLLPGILGYFQVDEAGLYSCPLLPSADNQKLLSEAKRLTPDFNSEDIEQRLKLRRLIRPLLLKHAFISSEYTAAPTKAAAAEERKRIDVAASSIDGANTDEDIIIRMGSLQFKWDDDGHILFYRDVWLGENKIVQGFIVKTEAFLLAPLMTLMTKSNFTTDLQLNIQLNATDVKTLTYSNQSLTVQATIIDTVNKALPIHIHRAVLAAPLKNIFLDISVQKLPLSSRGITWLYLISVVIGLILLGVAAIYKMGARQIELSQAQLNFISSVTHELKTPLASIIMYAEMLRENMVNTEVKKRTYYDYIYFEGERLGRLISNVLHLSKVGRDSQDLQLEYTPVSFATDLVRSRVSTLLENCEYHLNFGDFGAECGSYELLIDVDAFTQVAINLVDNAIKFSKEKCSEQPEDRKVDIAFHCDKDNLVYFSVRDFGPGIDEEHCKHIFNIFYRAGNELTRTTQGTGIGLALVQDLTKAMGGRVEFKNQSPGVEFRVYLKYRRV